jgi:hypothetical protein
MYLKILNKERPKYLSRSKNLSSGLDEPVKPKFTRYVKWQTLLIFMGFLSHFKSSRV